MKGPTSSKTSFAWRTFSGGGALFGDHALAQRVAARGCCSSESSTILKAPKKDPGNVVSEASVVVEVAGNAQAEEKDAASSTESDDGRSRRQANRSN